VTDASSFVQRKHVRFRDRDAMGHVTDAVYSRRKLAE
jgi:acyl-CoA thioesterase FadM